MEDKTATPGPVATRKQKMGLAPRPSGTGKVSAASSAVQQFLASEFDARECRITKIAPVNDGWQGWSAEAEILVPNLDIKSLGLALTTEILEQERYLVELDLDLAVRSFEFLDMNDSRA